MMSTISLALLVLAAGGFALLAVQLAALVEHMRQPVPKLAHSAPISILKPLCGLDDNLAANLESFASLAYPTYEVLLGVKDTRDLAYPLARAMATRYPGLMRLVLQQGEPGLNPKVNQLMTLAAAARYDTLVVSDSNVRVAPSYLAEIAAHLADPEVGLVTHPVVGTGGQRMGSVMDNLHMTGTVAAGVVGAKRVAGQDIVVGKSMALRRRDLARLGGFRRMRDLLAEDYVLGRLVRAELGKRIVIGRLPVENVTCQASVRDFLRRYRRWSVMHRKAVGPLVYAGEVLLNPVLLAGAALAVAPSMQGLYGFGLAGLLRVAYEEAAARTLGRPRFRLRELLAAPAKDVVMGAAWLHGWLHDTVEWRSNRLRVLPGTRLLRPTHPQPRKRARAARPDYAPRWAQPAPPGAASLR